MKSRIFLADDGDICVLSLDSGVSTLSSVAMSNCGASATSRTGAMVTKHSPCSVCKVSVWLNDARDFGSFNRIYMECFGAHRPARSTVEARLMIDAKVEIDVTAYKPR